MEAVSKLAIEVEDLDEPGLLEVASEAERLDREVQLEKLRLAYEWCVQHPATSESGTATWGDAGLAGFPTATHPWVVTARRVWRRSWRKSLVPRWVSPPSPRCR